MDKRGKKHKNHTIVVVNDDVTQLRTLSGILKNGGDISVIAFSSATEALTTMSRKEPPDLIVTDLYMPVIDGWRFCRLLRSPEYPEFNQIPILIVSATFAGEAPQQICAEVGANAFLPAPIDGSRFFDQVHALLAGEILPVTINVLIVDDCKPLACMLKTAFEAHGWCVHVAINGADALRLFREQLPEIVVLDYHLPDVTGDTLLENMKQLKQQAVIIMMTADPDPALAVEWMRKGASAYVRKPFTPEYMINLCENARRERSLLFVEDCLAERTCELRESEARFRILFEGIPDGVIMHDAAGVILDCNEVVAHRLEMPMVDILGLNIRDIITLDDAAMVAERTRTIASGNIETFATVYISRTGKRILAEISEREICWQGRKVLLSVSRDVTQRQHAEEALREIEERLRHSEKMDAIGQLAGGIAHDFNNQLTGIMGYAEVLAMHLDGKPLYHCAENILKAAKRSADLTAQLLVFARKGHYQSVPVNIHKTIDEVINLLSHSIDKRIEMHLRLDADSAVIMGDPSQFQNALLNLAINACDAMPEGGELTFATDLVTIEPEHDLVHRYQTKPGLFLRLRITDTGIGMDEATRKRIFEPFFTTKGQGEGTGMGLAAVYGTIKKLHGAITVRSKVGHGTTFMIYLPLAKPTSSEDSKKAHSTSAIAPAWILVVDDEEVVRNTTAERLRVLGHKATICKDGAEAIEHYRASWRNIDLIILDIVVPKISGRDAFAAMRAINPKIKVLLASGYSVDGEAQYILDQGALGFLQKPFRHAELAAKVAKVLSP